VAIVAVIVCVAACSTEKAATIATSPSATLGASEEITLQVRLVTREHAEGCQRSAANPDPSAQTKLFDRKGTCFALARAALDITKVAKAGPIEDDRSPGNGGLKALLLRLAAEDARALSGLTSANVGKRLALVMFGRVVIAPDVQVPIDNGQMALSGLSADEARRAARALDPSDVPDA